MLYIYLTAFVARLFGVQFTYVCRFIGKSDQRNEKRGRTIWATNKARQAVGWWKALHKMSEQHEGHYYLALEARVEEAESVLEEPEGGFEKRVPEDVSGTPEDGTDAQGPAEDQAADQRGAGPAGEVRGQEAGQGTSGGNRPVKVDLSKIGLAPKKATPTSSPPSGDAS